jgi:sulfide:quinone oxidoreductase
MSKHITVIGGGFAALTAARCLRQHDSAAKITLLAPQPALIYLPSLIWLPSGKRKPKDLVVPLRKFFRAHASILSPARQPGSARTAGVETSAGAVGQ